MSPLNESDPGTRHEAWARFRFAVIGRLLSSPPKRGELKQALGELAARLWRHPLHGAEVRFGFSTIETWYYRARAASRDPVGALRRALRKDRGRRTALGEDLKTELLKQYASYKEWSYQLHFDNLKALVEEKPSLGPMPSYSSVRRFMTENGYLKEKPTAGKPPGQVKARERFESREIRSFEAEYVGALWHLDFHHGSRAVLTPDGRWQKPVLFAVIDDYSRLCCHAQWYLHETAEVLVHGYSQAVLKRGNPRTTMTDNGSAMTSAEFTSGIERLGQIHETILAYSPFQNGKQEKFFDTFEGRLMKMLKHLADLTLNFLNQATVAYVELDYNKSVHEEIGDTPLNRFLQGPSVLRNSPSSEDLRLGFRRTVTRKLRQSDGTVKLGSVRFEIPDRFRHLRRVKLRYAEWDRRSVDMVDPVSGKILSRVYPLDKARNADGKRRARAPRPLGGAAAECEAPRCDLPPLLRKLMRQYSATGLPPAYIPLNRENHEELDR
jgi:transposase InsO family protein